MIQFFKRSKRGGFTLVELLVVISIISLLASTVFASLNSARAKARDAQRVQALNEMRKAIELYFDNNGNYPPASYLGLYNGVWSVTSCSRDSASWTTLQGNLATYIPTLSKDPVNTNPNIDFCIPPLDWSLGLGFSQYAYFYITNQTRSDYDLVTVLEKNETLMCKNKHWQTHVYKIFGPSPPDTWCGAGIMGIENLYQANH